MLIIVCGTIRLLKLALCRLQLAMISKHDILNIFGENVRKQRRILNISQEELAHRAELHRTYIGMIERAEKNITLVNMEKIANALQVKIEDLLKNQQSMEITVEAFTELLDNKYIIVEVVFYPHFFRPQLVVS